MPIFNQINNLVRWTSGLNLGDFKQNNICLNVGSTAQESTLALCCIASKGLYPYFTVTFYRQKTLWYQTVLDSFVFQSQLDISTSLEGQMCGKSEFVYLWEHLGLVELIEAVFV